VQHILCNQHEYGPIGDKMTLLKPIKKTSMSIPYEQLYIQMYRQHGHLITEQSSGETNPLFQLVNDPGPSVTLYDTHRSIQFQQYIQTSSIPTMTAAGSSILLVTLLECIQDARTYEYKT
jgi:hypothetical protein